METLKLSGNMRVVSFCESGDQPKQAADSLLKEATSLLKIATGMHQMSEDAQESVRGDIREFIQRVEKR